ncbi:VOC family protein [Streptomyces sp. NPDC002458]|uniref:VOC family protein n=1 Tax=Streptomyces sp. NBC_00148 TaxID=2903626 RepID=A0AAU1LZM7_9ACTN
MTTDTKPRKLAYSLHHANIPVTDFGRTTEWYSKVFGLEPVSISKFVENPTTLLMSNGNFHVHFERYPEVVIPRSTFEHRTGANLFHFCIEVTDWEEFMAHLDELGIERYDLKVRPQDGSKSCDLLDPDGHQVEVAWHSSRDW